MVSKTSTATNKIRKTNALYLKTQRFIAETHTEGHRKTHTEIHTQRDKERQIHTDTLKERHTHIETNTKSCLKGSGKASKK